MDVQIAQAIRQIHPKEKTVYVSNDDYQGVQALCIMEQEDPTTFYFSTRRTSGRTRSYQRHPNVALYMTDRDNGIGVELHGNMVVHVDDVTKNKLWHDSLSAFFPGGVDDPEYCVLCFKAVSGEYVQSEQRIPFTADELIHTN